MAPTDHVQPSRRVQSASAPQSAHGGASAGRCARAWTIALLTAAIALTADLWIKAWAFENVARVPVELGSGDRIPQHDQIDLVPNVLSLKLTTNKGAVFGLGQGGQVFFIIISVAAVFVLGRVFWVSRASAHLTHIALALIFAGAIGNLYDRLRFSEVRDMLWLFPDVKLPFGLHWPGKSGSDLVYPWIFNIADAALVVGVGMMLLIMWFSPKPPPADQKSRD